MPLGWVAAGAAVVDAVGNISQGKKADKRAGQQLGLEERSLAMEERRDAQRQQYGGLLDTLINHPDWASSQMPGFAFGLDQGTEAVRRKMASTGYAGSGNEAAGLMEYGQNYAQNFYQSQAQLLGQLSGLIAPPQNVASPGYGQAAAGFSGQSQDAYGRAMSSIGYGIGSWGGNFSNSGYAGSTAPMSGSPMYSGGYGYNMPGG